MITIKFNRILCLLALLTTAYEDTRSQVTMTIDAAALDANQIHATPFPTIVTNSPILSSYGHATEQSPDLRITISQSSLTDEKGKTFPTSLISRTHTNYHSLVAVYERILKFSPGTPLPFASLFLSGFPVSDQGINSPILYPVFNIVNLGRSAWKQGTYSSSFKLEDWQTKDNRLPTGPGPGIVTPAMGTLTVIVSSLLKITPPAITPLNLNINDLSYFRKGYQSINTNEKTVIGLQHTVPFSINLPSPLLTYNGVNQANQAKTFTCTFDLKTNVVNGNVISGTTGKSFNITDIPVGNKTKISIAYGLSANILKQNFLRSGTYESPNGNTMTVNEIMSDASQGITNDLTIPELKVTVSDLKELIIKDKEVNLEFKTAADYINGVKVTMPAHLRTSSTNPFKLTVKAESATFLLNGASSQLPCSLLQLESPEGKSDIQRLSLSTTDQTLLSDAVPVIDRDIDVTYHIPPNPLLVPAPKGIYTLKLTYTMETL